MNPLQPQTDERTPQAGGDPLPNGPAGAAILSAGAGCAVLGILAVAGDASKAAAKLLTFYLPTGPLSGVTCLAILFWLVMWFVLAKRWRWKNISIGKINTIGLVLLALGILLTFPPFADFLQGK